MSHTRTRSMSAYGLHHSAGACRRKQTITDLIKSITSGDGSSSSSSSRRVHPGDMGAGAGRRQVDRRGCRIISGRRRREDLAVGTASTGQLPDRLQQQERVARLHRE